ncbi:CopG family antitoxin [Chloroflexota bacterium]
MTKGRNTTPITVRLPDELIRDLHKRARIKGIGYTVLIRHYLQEKCGQRLT